MNVGEFYKVSNLANENKRRKIGTDFEHSFAQAHENPFASIPDEADIERAHEERKHQRKEEQATEYSIDEILDSAPNVEPLNAKNVRKLVQSLEKAISKNQKLRMKNASEPEKFMESEMELDEEIRNTMQLAAHPDQYGILVEMQMIPSIISLLTHENTDIVVTTLQLLQELTDDQVIPDDADPKVEELLTQFIDSLCENQIFEILCNNLDRFNETEPDEQKGIFMILGLVENIVSLKPNAADLIAQNTTFVDWLLKRISVKEYSANSQYSSEILAILLQSSPVNQEIALKKGAMDVVLSCLAPFRKRDPEDDDHQELMENLFNCACALVNVVQGKKEFVATEGVELVCLMLKQKKLAGIRALKLMSHCVSGLGESGVKESCEKFIDESGLKHVFNALSKKNVKVFRKEYPKAYSENEEEEFALIILSAFFRHLTDDAPNFYVSRIISRFMDDNGDKFNLLLRMFSKYELILRKWIHLEEAKYKKEMYELGVDVESEEMYDSIYLKRLENGMFAMQMISLIILDLCSKEDETRTLNVKEKIAEYGISLETLQEVLEEYMMNIEESIMDEGKSSRAEKLRVVTKLKYLIPTFLEAE